jgi:hypothetical protein
MNDNPCTALLCLRIGRPDIAYKSNHSQSRLFVEGRTALGYLIGTVLILLRQSMQRLPWVFCLYPGRLFPLTHNSRSSRIGVDECFARGAAWFGSAQQARALLSNTAHLMELNSAFYDAVMNTSGATWWQGRLSGSLSWLVHTISWHAARNHWLLWETTGRPTVSGLRHPLALPPPIVVLVSIQARKLIRISLTSFLRQ